MNVFDTLFPPRSRAPSAAAGRSRGSRQPVRRNRLAGFSGEKLEDRLALAVVTSFTPVFTANLTGNISFAANTLMTAPGNTPEAIAARNGTGPQNTLNNDYWNMAYVNIDSDPNTFNASSADLVIPVGANVEFARLYWGGRCADTVSDALLETVKFKVGAGAYSSLTGALVGKVVGGVVGRTDIQTYQCFADVKSLVAGAGTYTVANVQGQAGAKNTCNGWSLVVAYSAPGSPGEVPRNLTVFQGFAEVKDSTADRNVTIPFSGFQAPATGPVNATLGFVTYEGDLGIPGDQAFFKSQSSATETLLSDLPAIPDDNFFNSTISNRGVLVTSKNPDYVNQFGFDADLVTADGIIKNGDTGAQIRVTSTQDQYYPGVITSAIDIRQPAITATKTVEDLNGGVVDPGDTLKYTVQVSNAAGLFDGATNVVLDDLIPANTTYVPGSLVIFDGANPVSKTDALDEDTAEFTGAGVRFQLGVGATGTPSPQGGSLAPGETATVTFRVQVNPSIIGGTTITNTAVVSYASQTFGVADSKKATVSIDCPAVDLKIEKTSDVSVVTAGDGVNHTFTITVTNTSTSAANNVVVADTWPAGFVPGTIVPPAGTTITGPDPVTGNFTWTIGTLAGKKTVTLTAQYTVPASTSPGTEKNKAVVKTSTFDPNPENNTATSEVTVLTNAVLQITKTDDPDPVTAGGTGYTYTITVKNTGPSDAQNVVVVDDLPTGFVTTGFSGPGTLPVVGADPFTWTLGKLIAGATAQLVVTYRVDSGVAPNSYTNIATASSPTDKQGPRTATCETAVKSDAILSIVKDALPTSLVAGATGTFTITVTNTGKFTQAKDVVVVDTLPLGFTVTGYSAVPAPETVGPAVPTTGPVTWTIGTLAAGVTRSLTLTYVVGAGVEPGVYKNSATVTSKNDIPRTDDAEVTVGSDAILSIVKAPKVQGANAGDGITYSYTITVTNSGISNARNVTVVDTWPKPAGSIQQGTITVTAGTPPIPQANGDFTWVIDSLPTGTATLTVTYTVPLTTPIGDYVNNVSMTSAGFPTPLTDFATTVVLPPIPTSDTPALILGTDDGCNVLGIVRVIDPVTGGQLASFVPYPGFKGSVRVTSGDVNGDGLSDIVVAPGRGRPGLVRVFNADGTPLANGNFDFYPFGSAWRGGVEVAVGNVVGTAPNEIIAATSTGKPLVNVFTVNGTSVVPTPVRSFQPFPKPYAAGVMLTVGDYGTYTNGSWSGVPDGRAEIAVGTNAGVPAQVRIFNAAPSTPVLLRSFLPFGSKFRQGVTLASARFSSAVIEDVFVGTGVGGKSQLKSFDGSGMMTGDTNAFTTFFSKSNAMLFSAALDLSGANGKVNSIYGAQGRGGLNGLPSGVGRFTGTPPATQLGSWKAPLRIAPILIGPTPGGRR